MSTISYFVIGYFIVGFILTYIWWKDEYEAEYEIAKEEEEAEDSMLVFFITTLVFFWPIKAIKNYFESFLE